MRLERALAEVLRARPAPRFLLAYSGGVDSRVLLELLVRLRARRPFELRAVHVNHHLQAAANRLASAALESCAALAIPCRVRHARGIERSGVSLEASARDARYRLLANELQTGEILLSAQHQDDQLETVLLQLMRGAGVDGLAAMPATAPFARGELRRPLLAWSRAEIEALARRWHLDWADDPSNADSRFDRNYLRLEVIPLLRRRWPAAAATVARSAALMADAAQVLAERAAEDLARVSLGAAVSIERLRALSRSRQRLVVRLWLQNQGFALPDRAHLERMLSELPDARPDRHPEVVWPGGVVWRERGRLHAGPKRAAIRADSDDCANNEPLRWHWCDQAFRDWSWRSDARGPIDGDRLPATLEIQFRRGGEKLRPGPQAARRPLKDLLREAAVPARQRAAVPLFYAGGLLLAVGDLYVNYDHPAVGGRLVAGGRITAAIHKVSARAGKVIAAPKAKGAS